MLYIAQVLLSAAVLAHIYVFRFLQPTHLHFFLLMYLYVGEVKQYFPGVDLWDCFELSGGEKNPQKGAQEVTGLNYYSG